MSEDTQTTHGKRNNVVSFYRRNQTPIHLITAMILAHITNIVMGYSPPEPETSTTVSEMVFSVLHWYSSPGFVVASIVLLPILPRLIRPPRAI